MDKANRKVSWGLKSPRILDAGFGAGRDINEFRIRKVTVDGVDYSAPAVAKLRNKFPNGKFFLADLRQTGLPDSTYDGIWACASIINLRKSDAPLAIKEFARLLKSDGKLFISVKEGNGEEIIPDRAGERLFSFFSEKELRELIETNGFIVENTELVEDSALTGKMAPSTPRWICSYAKKRS